MASTYFVSMIRMGWTTLLLGVSFRFPNNKEGSTAKRFCDLHTEFLETYTKSFFFFFATTSIHASPASCLRLARVADILEPSAVSRRARNM